MKKNKVENKNPENKKSLLKTIRKDISDWRKNNISDVLKYNPNSEEYVNYYYYTKEEREEISKNPEFLDENNFRLQIGKMQKD